MKELLVGLVLPQPEPDSEPEPEPDSPAASVVPPPPPPRPPPSASAVSASRRGPSSTANPAPRRLESGLLPGGRKQSRRRVRADSPVASDVRDSPPKKKTSLPRSLPKSSAGSRQRVNVPSQGDKSSTVSRQRDNVPSLGDKSSTGSRQRAKVPSQSEGALTPPTDLIPRRKSGRINRDKSRG